METLVRENQSVARERDEQFITPPASVMENGESYSLKVEMPGVNREGLEISLEKSKLTILGQRSLAAIDGTVLHRESRAENFRRVFELDPSIDLAKIGAKMDQGVLTLTLPKAEQVKPRKISVE